MERNDREEYVAAIDYWKACARELEADVARLTEALGAADKVIRPIAEIFDAYLPGSVLIYANGMRRPTEGEPLPPAEYKHLLEPNIIKDANEARALIRKTKGEQ